MLLRLLSFLDLCLDVDQVSTMNIVCPHFHASSMLNSCVHCFHMPCVFAANLALDHGHPTARPDFALYLCSLGLHWRVLLFAAHLCVSPGPSFCCPPFFLLPTCVSPQVLLFAAHLCVSPPFCCPPVCLPRSMLEAFKLGGDFHSRTAYGMYDEIQADIAAGECTA